MDVDDLLVKLGVDEKPKERIDLGSNTEAGFTGHEVTYRDPDPCKGDHVIQLWVGKEVFELDMLVRQGFFPDIHKDSRRVKLEKLRFSNLYVNVLLVFEDLLSTGKLLAGDALDQLIEWDEEE